VRQKWEYKVQCSKSTSTEEELQKYGAEGWELTAVLDDRDGWYVLFFKRPA
jgi:hypothetical protein